MDLSKTTSNQLYSKQRRLQRRYQDIRVHRRMEALVKLEGFIISMAMIRYDIRALVRSRFRRVKQDVRAKKLRHVFSV